MFKKYEFKSSINRKKSRIVQGGTATTTNDKISWVERRNINQQTDPLERKYKLTVVTVNRIDMLANMFYGNTELEWIILQYNNIVDISDLSVGDEIAIPSVTYVNRMILNKTAML